MKNSKDRKQRALITAWRKAANEASTADAAVTYRDCADALEAAIAVRILVAVCEGCWVSVQMPSKSANKVYPDLPTGWSQCGTSKLTIVGHGKRLAAWCQACRLTRKSVS